MILFDWQKDVLRRIYGDQADEVLAWLYVHLPPPTPHVETLPHEGDDASPWISDEAWERCIEDTPLPTRHYLNRWCSANPRPRSRPRDVPAAGDVPPRCRLLPSRRGRRHRP